MPSMLFIGLTAQLLLSGCNQELSIKDMAAPEDYPDVAPGDVALRRLTSQQLENAIHDVFGSDIVVPNIAEPDVALEGLFSIGASSATYSSRGVESLEAASYSITDQIFEDQQARAVTLICEPSSSDDEQCASEIIRSIGKKIWRRSLLEEEVEQLVGIFTQAATALGTFEDGIQYAFAALLQSPNFLYRAELGEQGQFSSVELASRLSFFLWNSIPDDELIQAAESGELNTREGLFAQALRMLQSPKANAGVANFFIEYLRLYQLDGLSKDPTLFEHFSTDLGPDARQETLSLIDYLIFEVEDDFRNIYTTKESFINHRLAAIYDVPAPNNDAEFGYVDLPEDRNRAGILGHVSFLALNSHAVSTSATLRGRAVRSILLCQTIPPAPVNVDTSIPEPSGTTLTLRDRVAEHLADPSCAGCHELMDPIGLGLENYDSIGRWRTTDNGATIDPSGTLDTTDFSSAVELGQAIANHSNVGYCLTRSFGRYAIGRVETDAEDALVEVLEQRLEHHEYQVKPLLLEIVMSPLFQQAGSPKE